MELIRELPAVFEEFAEARRNSFVKVKEVKDAGVPVIGSYCIHKFLQRRLLKYTAVFHGFNYVIIEKEHIETVNLSLKQTVYTLDS